MMYCVIKQKILPIFYIVLLAFNIQYTNALISNAKAKQLSDQEAAEKLEQQKQEEANKSNDSQASTYSTTTYSTIPKDEQSTHNTNTVNQITFCATQDYEKTKMRSEISHLQKSNILLQERNKNSTALATASFDLEKSKLRENNKIEAIKKEEMINNNIKSFVAVDNNLSQERTERIWYRKVLATPEN